MQIVTASEAKQNFGALIAKMADGPVAIERHHKTVAVIMSPEAAKLVSDPRQAARAAQQQRELQRLMRHQQLAIEFLCAPREVSQKALRSALQVVERWQSEQLCSPDYIQRWRQWLSLPLFDLATVMCSDAEGWGPAMRQNSPFTAIIPA